MESTDEMTPNYPDHNLMSRLRELLLEKERAKVQNLEDEVDHLEKEIERIHSEILTAEEVVPLVTQHMGDITKEAVEGQSSKMARALSPIIGEATRYQIQESREEMVEALYPIVGAAVSRAVAEALNDLRKRIDQQIRPNKGGVEVTLMNRLRGVDPASVAFRNALPFQINQLFLIQHDSGLVLEFVNQNTEELNDHDLVSSMLTAIRSFVNDSFSPDSNDDELHEVYFGEDRIIIESGTVAYAAAVISGVEPEGFRAMLRMFVNELHIQNKEIFEAYDGDPETLPDLKPAIDTFIEEAQNKDKDQSNNSVLDLSNEQSTKMLRTVGLVSLLLLLGTCAFYSVLTYRILPFAFGSDRFLSNSTSEPIQEVAPVTIVVTATPEAFREPEPIPSPSQAQLELKQIELASDKWSRTYPDGDAPQFVAVEAGTELKVIRILGGWVEAEWTDPELGIVNGWIRFDWLGDNE